LFAVKQAGLQRIFHLSIFTRSRLRVFNLFRFAVRDINDGLRISCP
jgi:hypothetical protein